LIELGILGPLEVRRDGAAVEVRAAKERALLALLVLHVNEVVPAERLIEALWGDARPETAEHALQVYVSSLRRALGREAIVTRAGGYVLEIDEVDARRFEELVERGRTELRRDAEAASEMLGAALDLWRGPALADVAYEEFAQTEIARLEELRALAVEDRIEADLRLGRHNQLVAELDALVDASPLRERLRAQQMLALYRSGRQADALEAYRRARETLVDELGLDPSTELRELEAAILRQDPALDVEPAELRARRHLPTPATSFFGRRDELAGVLERFRSSGARLVTLVGPGGAGKTRLALEAARELASDNADGVYFVDLAPVTDPALLDQAIAAALGADDAASVGDRVAGRRILVVLDNFEHLDAAAPRVGELLSGAPELSVLVTSRSPLRLYGEHAFDVPPLAQEDASQLFVARALAAGRTLQPTPQIDELCEWLERLPLAIELVAARVREMSPERLLADLPARLEAAAAGPRDAPERHQALRSTIDWSYRLLGEPERILLARLAVFAGGFTPAAATEVCDAELTHVAALVSASLLVERETEGEPRLALLESVHEYALERLEERGEADSMRARHAEHFLGVAEEAREQVELSVGQVDALARLERELDNLRAALAWLAQHDAESGLRLATALRNFWLVRGHLSEGRRWLAELLADDVAPKIRADALTTFAVLAYRQGDLEPAKASWDEALGLYRGVGDTTGVARSIGELGSVAASEQDYERAVTLYEESAALFRDLSDPMRLAAVLGNLGAIANIQGGYERGRPLIEEALELNRGLGAKDNMALNLHNLGRVALLEGRSADGAEQLRESLELARELGYRELIAYGLAGLAEVASIAEDADRGARLVGAADMLFEELGVALSADDAESYERTVARLTQQLGDVAFDRQHSEGKTLELDRAVELALALPS
jgi:predicted ATPase/DNA-binding SARP family transcriptional activator